MVVDIKIYEQTPAMDVEDDGVDKPVWTMTHSWYAVMGGYCYRLREGSRIYLPDDHGREELALRDEALRFVVEHEPSIVPKLSVDDIADKSSTGAFVKVITLFQALWFSLQCIVRMGQGLSISLLELTTFAHCIVGIIIGWLWLKKPVDISQPDALDIPESAREPHWLMAILYTLSSFEKDESDEEKVQKLSPHKTAEANPLEVSTSTEEQDSTQPVYLIPLGEHAPLSFSDLDFDSRPPSSRPVTGRNTRAGSTARPGSRRPLTGASHISRQTVGSAHAASTSISTATSNQPDLSLSELIQAAADAERRLQLRMQLARKGWEHYIFPPQGSPAPGTVEASGNATGVSMESELEQSQQIVERRLKRSLLNTLVDRVPNFPRRRHYQPGDQLHKEHAIRTHLGITFTGFLYGGLHLLAWDATFTSMGEATLWKLAALSLTISGLLVPVTHAQGVISDVVRPWLKMDEEDRDAEEAAALAEKRVKWQDGWRRSWWKLYKWCFLWMVEVVRVLKVVIIAVVAAAYIGLRIFIFIECLINLAHLPPSAYEVVNWSQYVPHIS